MRLNHSSLARVLVGSLAVTLAAAPWFRPVAPAHAAIPSPSFRLLAPAQQVSSPDDPATIGMYRFNNTAEFQASTGPATRQYYVVPGHLDAKGHWAYAAPHLASDPVSVHSEELGIDLESHRVLIGLGAVSPAYAAAHLTLIGQSRRFPSRFSPLQRGSIHHADHGRGVFRAMASGRLTGQLTYHLENNVHFVQLDDCMSVGYDWDSGADTVSDLWVASCGEAGRVGTGWSVISGTISTIATIEIAGTQAYFNKNAEFQHLNQITQNTYDCEADFNSIEAIGHASGGTSDNTSTFVPGLYSPDHSRNCSEDFYSTSDHTWQ